MLHRRDSIRLTEKRLEVRVSTARTRGTVMCVGADGSSLALVDFCGVETRIHKDTDTIILNPQDARLLNG
jgi:hypothetical protein